MDGSDIDETLSFLLHHPRRYAIILGSHIQQQLIAMYKYHYSCFMLLYVPFLCFSKDFHISFCTDFQAIKLGFC